MKCLSPNILRIGLLLRRQVVEVDLHHKAKILNTIQKVKMKVRMKITQKRMMKLWTKTSKTKLNKLRRISRIPMTQSKIKRV